ncbi:hypothetical protein FB45DRAFT_933847 [Roridomyces roridus]|uniref:Uncharacterized protein n=1 Tax=Roridomyces roridus TaxID=1738132 RepID=A0AAD7BCM3_9AGAR|nr:hypothetical protein FB45DRAFT_933847 [Roridomyces roridus]
MATQNDSAVSDVSDPWLYNSPRGEWHCLMANDLAPTPMFPEDIERLIHQTLLHDSQEMRGVMALVAARFHLWTKPFIYRTVVIRRRDDDVDWMQRTVDFLLPNAGLIRTLALDLPFSGRQGPSFEEELTHIRKLLRSASRIVSLAATWNMWSRLSIEIGSLELQNIYLFWAGSSKYGLAAPSLSHLRHPQKLLALTIADPLLCHHTPLPSGWYYTFSQYRRLPETERCTNLRYLAYGTARVGIQTLNTFCQDHPHIEAVFMFTTADIIDVNGDLRQRLQAILQPNCYGAWVVSSSDVLQEWLARTEGRESVLDYRPHPRDAE